MKNKKAQAWGILLVVIVAIGFIALIIAGVQQGWFSKEKAVETTKEELAIIGCDVEPYLTTDFTDITNPGTAITPGAGILARVNDKYVGLITLGSSGEVFSIDDTVDIIGNGSNYLDKEIK